MADHVIAYCDPENNRIVLQVVDETDIPIFGPGLYASVVIDLDDGNFREIKLREWQVCVDDGTGTIVQKTAIFLSSDTY
jgi:hypothetical protein